MPDSKQTSAPGSALRLVLGDQLTPDIAALADIDRHRDVVLMAEVADETTYVRHHPKKIAFVLSAMRHFAAALEADGVRVDYVHLDDPANTGSIEGELRRAIDRHDPDRLVATEPGEYRLKAVMDQWADTLDRPVEIREDTRFLCDRATFEQWAEGRKQLRMEYFYRDMRRRTGLLMTADGKPVGGQWNFDPDNRARLPDDVTAPNLPSHRPDAMTQAVLALVEAKFGGGYENGGHFGDLGGFGFAVTRAEAEETFAAFIDQALPWFGDYQDAMRPNDPTLFHSVCSIYLNAGLLDPLTLCRAAEAAYHRGHAPLNAVEGFIRQIIGWREFVRGLYWRLMPDYADSNVLKADRPLPELYWTGRTGMACMADVIDQTRRHAYAHHIQRLMITGNFALLIGARPKEVETWYLAVYADAYEWVELLNTHGMALFADGGVLASKPYAAGGAYINRMSSYCRGCRYDVKKKTGPGACPFNYLYWDFLIRNAPLLKDNNRLAMPYRTLEKMKPERVDAIRYDARAFLDRLASGTESAETGDPTCR